MHLSVVRPTACRISGGSDGISALRATANAGSLGGRQVLITSGSQQALDLIGKVFLNPGDHVLVERPTCLGALQAWNAYQAGATRLSQMSVVGRSDADTSHDHQPRKRAA